MLTSADLPDGFVLSSETTFRTGHVMREFERRATRGPAYVGLVIILHDDVTAARATFEESRRHPRSAGSIPAPRPIGDEAYVFRFEAPEDPGGLPFESTGFGLVFRYANVFQSATVVSVSVVDAGDHVTITDLMEIAERQLARIRAR